MAFPDPIDITVNAVPVSMPRVRVGDFSASYQNSAETFLMEISHQTSKQGRVRSLAKLIEKAVVQNPLDSSNDYDTAQIHIVIDRPGFGFTEARIDQLVQAFKAWLTTANVGKLYGKQS
jgi:hypothetical protein